MKAANSGLAALLYRRVALVTERLNFVGLQPRPRNRHYGLARTSEASDVSALEVAVTKSVRDREP